MQIFKFRGKKTTLYYKDPKSQQFDDAVARKMFEKDNPGVDIEQIKQTEEKFALLKPKWNTDAAQSISDVPKKKRTQRPKAKGIVITEVSQTNSDRLVTRS